MAERFNAAVLKTVVLHGTGGSNPSLSAKQKPGHRPGFLFLLPLKARFQKELKQKKTGVRSTQAFALNRLPMGSAKLIPIYVCYYMFIEIEQNE